MKQEQANQAAREGGVVQVASKSLRDTILERVSRLLDSITYLVVDDFLREIAAIKTMLTRLQAPGRGYAVALRSETARSVLLELLMIPSQQDTFASAPPSTSTAASAELTLATRDAARIIHTLWQDPAATPTFEAVHRALEKSRHPPLTERLLFSSHPPDDAATTAAGNALPTLPSVPRSVACERRPQLLLEVKSVDEEARQTWVRIEGADDPEALALRGLFGRRVRLVYDDDAFPGLGKLLVLAQAADVRVSLRVVVQRGLGPKAAKQDLLSVSEVVDETRIRETIGANLMRMKAVDAELPFGEHDGASHEPVQPSPARRGAGP